MLPTAVRGAAALYLSLIFSQNSPTYSSVSHWHPLYIGGMSLRPCTGAGRVKSLWLKAVPHVLST